MDIKSLADLVNFRDEKFNKVNLFESENFFLDLYCLKPGQEQKIHTHAREDKVYVCVEGEVTATVGSEECVLQKNQSVCCPAGEEHGVRNHTQENAVCLVLMAPHPKPMGKAKG